MLKKLVDTEIPGCIYIFHFFLSLISLRSFLFITGIFLRRRKEPSCRLGCSDCCSPFYTLSGSALFSNIMLVYLLCKWKFRWFMYYSLDEIAESLARNDGIFCSSFQFSLDCFILVFLICCMNCLLEIVVCVYATFMIRES